MKWHKYVDLEPIRRLRNEGRELIGKEVLLTDKRDGENVSIYLVQGYVTISSHNLEVPSEDIVRRTEATPEFHRAIELLRDESAFKHEYILYGELLKKGKGATKIEPPHKNVHWILFDIYDCQEERYLPYNLIFQKAFHYKIPIVRAVDFFVPASLEDLFERRDMAFKWCRKHRREGVVGKYYGDQIFFKEKIDLPKLSKIPRKEEVKIRLPSMPQERVLRALQHAFDEVGEENWKDKKTAMPVVAKHFNAEGREHNYEPPRNMYQLYLETSMEILKNREVTEKC